MTHRALLNQYKESCGKDPEAFMLMIGKFASVRGILTETYNELVREGKCTPIESLPTEEKRELWNEANRISAVKERNFLIEVVKALHGFGSYLQMEEKI